MILRCSPLCTIVHRSPGHVWHFICTPRPLSHAPIHTCVQTGAHQAHICLHAALSPTPLARGLCAQFSPPQSPPLPIFFHTTSSLPCTFFARFSLISLHTLAVPNPLVQMLAHALHLSVHLSFPPCSLHTFACFLHAPCTALHAPLHNHCTFAHSFARSLHTFARSFALPATLLSPRRANLLPSHFLLTFLALFAPLGHFHALPSHSLHNRVPHCPPLHVFARFFALFCTFLACFCTISP